MEAEATSLTTSTATAISARLDSDQAAAADLRPPRAHPGCLGFQRSQQMSLSPENDPAAMAYEVKGQDMSPDDFTADAGWTIVAPRPSVITTVLSQPDLANLQRKGGNTNATVSTARNSLIKASRMPALPQDDIKIVIRVRGAINIAKVGQLTVTKAICMAACIEPNERSEDTICPNLKQNIMVVSTPSEANAAKYLRIHNISIGEQTQQDFPPLKNRESSAINDNVAANADARLTGERGRSRSRNRGRPSSRSGERSRNPSQRSTSRIRFGPSPREIRQIKTPPPSDSNQTEITSEPMVVEVPVAESTRNPHKRKAATNTHPSSTDSDIKEIKELLGRLATAVASLKEGQDKLATTVGTLKEGYDRITLQINHMMETINSHGARLNALEMADHPSVMSQSTITKIPRPLSLDRHSNNMASQRPPNANNKDGSAN
ncbi:hypothetical protein HPB49_024039 [Dermacentor silvarum]|uniref:Uncharacterized protein n=1 Tax=Dermacentor silvarum TaxID=543639 RepID=A0ACB8DGC8_DERSI|nr:hypothetical protein HPB49_024039 [Dermacentor silvarum]